MRKRGMYTGMITNGFLLSKDRIETLNDAGLEYLQISIDNVTPDEVSKKSLKTLDSRLEWLSQYAVFQVNINSVLGSGVKNPEDALADRTPRGGTRIYEHGRNHSRREWPAKEPQSPANRNI